MGLCGLMAWRSVLAGNMPMEVPDFRIKEVRDRYRNDNGCCTPEVAGDQLMPVTTYKLPEHSDEVYENMRKQWLGEKCDVNELF